MKKKFGIFSKLVLIGAVVASMSFSLLGNDALANSAGKNDNKLDFEITPEGRYDITFKENPSLTRSNAKASNRSALQSRGGEIVGEYEYSPNTITVEMNEKAIKAIAKNPNVEKIEADYLVEPEAVYSAPFHSNAWSIDSHNANQAYSRGYSGQNVNFLVLDSGVDKNHPMLRHAIKGGGSVVSWTNDYQDYTGHGTKVAGTVASKHEGKPYGIAPDVDLYSVVITVSKTDGRAHVSDMTRGIEWGINNGMDVINISFSANGTSVAFERASNVAKRANIMISHSAGNSIEDRDSNSGRCAYASVYCISAIDRNDNIASFSAYGVRNIEQGAGGVSVPVVSLGGNSPTTASGTSMASPMFGGLYALHKSEYLNASVDQIISSMRNSSKSVSTSRPIGYGKAYYSPMNTYGQNHLGVWNYYYKSDNRLSVSASEHNSNRMMSRISYELWELSYGGNESYVKPLGIVKNVYNFQTTIHVDNPNLDPNKKYLIKTIVDFSNGERQWRYEPLRGMGLDYN